MCKEQQRRQQLGSPSDLTSQSLARVFPELGVSWCHCFVIQTPPFALTLFSPPPPPPPFLLRESRRREKGENSPDQHFAPFENDIGFAVCFNRAPKAWVPNIPLNKKIKVGKKSTKVAKRVLSFSFLSWTREEKACNPLDFIKQDSRPCCSQLDRRWKLKKE